MGAVQSGVEFRLSMYARGMTTRDIQAHLEEMYGVEVSPALISEVTDAVVEEVRAWQSRPLEAIYPILYLDALMVKMRHEGRVENRAVFVGIGVTLEGSKEVLGLWTSATEGAKFWLQILTEIRIHFVQTFGLHGRGLLPASGMRSGVSRKRRYSLLLQTVRNSLNYVNWKERKTVAADLKLVYRAATVEEAEQRLSEFEQRWDPKYSSIGKMWRRNWAGIVPFFAFPAEIRRAVYTTNIVESLNMSLRKVIKTRGSFPGEEAALKLLYLALKNVAKRWQACRDWKVSLNHFVVLWGDRIEAAQARPSR